MKRLGVVVHPTRDVLESIGVLERWTAERGVQLVQVMTGEQPAVAPPGEVGACDLVVALGGDGTILKALHAAARTRTPVLGVAYGSLGALTTVPRADFVAGLERFAGGDWRALELSALAVEAEGARIATALNDVVLVRGRGTQLILDISVDGELYVRAAGDGVIVATAVGSSAYSMAAGGSLLAPGTEAFVCTPLSMHGGCAPPLVVSTGAEVVIDVSPGHTGFYLNVDGFPVETREQRFTVTSQDAHATLVAFDDAGGSLKRLRDRGLIADSPRVLGQDRRAVSDPGLIHQDQVARHRSLS